MEGRIRAHVTVVRGTTHTCRHTLYLWPWRWVGHKWRPDCGRRDLGGEGVELKKLRTNACAWTCAHGGDMSRACTPSYPSEHLNPDGAAHFRARKVFDGLHRAAP